VVWGKHRGVLDVEHVGSAYDEARLAVLLRVAQDRIHAGQDVLDFGLADPSPAGGFPIVASCSARLWEALGTVWGALGFGQAFTDVVFEKIVLARVVEPTSKKDAIRVLEGLGVAAPSYRSIQNALDRCEERGYRAALEAACAKHVDVAALRLCLY
jgi:hypothetical protein